MSMRRIEADLRNIGTPEALQVYLGYLLRAPGWYGENLDALYDVLTEIARPTCLCFRLPSVMTPAMEAYWPRLRRVLEDAAEASPAFCWTAE